MKVLVTGAAGFVGLALLERLLADGRTVIAFDRRPLPATLLPRFNALHGTLTPVQGDVMDAAAVAAALQAHKVTHVIHAAAITSAASREAADPAAVVGVNLVGTANVTHAACVNGVQRFVLIGSISAFGSGHPGAATFDDETPHAPRTLYALGKSGAETVVARLSELHGLDWVVGRLGWVYGPYEYATGLRDTLNAVHQLTAAARAGRAVSLPRPARRNWHFVRDAVHGLVTLLDAPALRHRAYNLGPGHVWALTQWCALLAERYPAFQWSVGGEAETIELYADQEGALLGGERFRAEFGTPTWHDLAAAFAAYMRFLDETDGFGMPT
jgi:UDP-glucuronate 4-epimerase